MIDKIKRRCQLRNIEYDEAKFMVKKHNDTRWILVSGNRFVMCLSDEDAALLRTQIRRLK